MKKVLVLLVTYIGIISLLSFTDHEFHTSMTKVEYNSGSKEIKLSSKLDAEDFEKAVGAKISDGNFKSKSENYLKNNVQLSVNGSPVSITLGEVSQSGEVLWIYYSVSNINEVNSIEITNTILFNLFADQTNIINFFVNNKREFFQSKKGNDSVKKTF